MKITKIRIKGVKPTDQQLRDIILDLERRISKAGFITEVSELSSTSIKLGLHSKSFILNTTKHGRNLQCNPYHTKLTNLPTWDQRVEYNDIVNDVLNEHDVSANVTSGPYTIRKGIECMTEDDWYNQKPEWVLHNESRGYHIESVDEKEYLEEKRIERNEKAKIKRAEKFANKQLDLTVRHLKLV